jgi:outer membrane protein OmpA-like peptidoglycan-associated protein/flagellar hook assembly protein FlgD
MMKSLKSKISGPVLKTAAAVLLGAALLAPAALRAADPPVSPFGADAVPDLYAPSLAGPGGFTTSTGGAPASALNPAQGGTAQRIIFDLGYLAIPVFPALGNEPNTGGYMQALEAGMLFPTRYGVFGGSLRYIGGFERNQFAYFPINPTFSGNIFAAKELYPGMSLGAGLNFGAGEDWTLSADLGFRYNTGRLGPLHNFTWAIAMRGLGKSYFPTWFTPMGGVGFDLVRVEGEGDKRDPFVMNVAADLGFPSIFYWPKLSMIFKAGFSMTIAECVTLSASWPGASGLNARELHDYSGMFRPFQPIPSIGLGVDIILPSGGKRIAGGRLPSDGDLKIDTAFKPLYEGVTAVGAGLTWMVGVADKKAPAIEIEYPEPAYISPNHDGKADYLEFPWNITDSHYIVSWAVEIKDEAGAVVRTIVNKEQRPEFNGLQDFFVRLFSVKKQVEVPPDFQWDGFRDSGDIAPDGSYSFTITAVDDSGNTAVSPAYTVVIDTAPPDIQIDPLSDTQRIFNPTAEGSKAVITFTPHGSKEEVWESGIYNTAGVKVRGFENESGTPAPRVWNGRDDTGQIAPDGVYTYRISATDRAQNTASAELANIILDARVAGVFLTSSVTGIAPRPGQSTDLVDFGVHLSLAEGVDNWRLELKDSGGTVLRRFAGDSQIPASIGWDGLDQNGSIREGVYTPELTVIYTKGDVVKAAAAPVTVDISGPDLTFNSQPEYFSPDNDGVEDDLLVYLTAADISPIASWSLEIREPEPPYPVFYRIEGRGRPAERLLWNGRSNKGELVQSATDYPYTFRAEDSLGNASSIDGKIGVDVLVIRDGDRLRIQIPSIVFRPNFADFDGLSKDVVDNNTRILRRIAGILNKFRDYKVMVEGHANPTQPAGPARAREEPELKRLSESRAKAVVDQLTRFGVARSRLFATGVGGERTIVPFEDRDNWWKNRRVEFILIK